MKLLSLLAAVLLTVGLLAGCGGEESEPKEEAPAPASQEETTTEAATTEDTPTEETAVSPETTVETAAPESTTEPSSPSAESSEDASEDQGAASATVTVTRVVDGDTVEIYPAIDGIEDVRLIGVDTPETTKPGCLVQPYGPEASAFTQERLQGRSVGLEFDQERTDRYDRLLAYVYPPEGTMFNETLLREGYAYVSTFPPNTRYVERFEEVEAEARADGRGIWGLAPETLAALLTGECSRDQPEAPQQQPQQQSAPNASEPTPNPPAVPVGGARCSDFATEAEAIAALPSNPQLDRDGDGKACESLP